MSDEVRRIKELRDAFVRGWADRDVQAAYPAGCRSTPLDVAARLYPLPTVEIPRVVIADNDKYRLFNGVLQRLANDGSGWHSILTPSVVLAVAALHANHTERVEATE